MIVVVSDGLHQQKAARGLAEELRLHDLAVIFARDSADDRRAFLNSVV